MVATVGGPRQVATDLRFWELNKFKELMTDKAYWRTKEGEIL